MQPPKEPRVLAVCGSLRDDSRTRLALVDVLAAARSQGAGTDLLDLRDYDVPSLFELEDSETDAEQLRRRLGTADSVVLGTPNYHGSFSGALKDALDYCGTDEFEGTTVGLLEVAAGEFPGGAVSHLRTVCRTLHAWTLPTEVVVLAATDRITEDGIADENLAARARRLGTELVDYAGVSAFPSLVRNREGTTEERRR